MGMAAYGVVTVGVFARVEQHADNLDAIELRRQGKRQVAVARAGDGKHVAEILDAAQCGRDRQIDASAVPDQSVSRFQLAVQHCWFESAVGVRSMVAEQIDEWKLRTTFTRDSACSHKPERLVECGRLGAGIDNNFGYLDNVRG